MKVLLIHNKYGKFSGEEAVVEAQLQMLEARGHQVITYYRSSEELPQMRFGKLKAFVTALENPRSKRELKALILKEQPDVVHVHNLYPLISPAVLKMIKHMGLPIVMTVHNYRLACPNGLFYTKNAICEKCLGFGKEWNCLLKNCEDNIFKSAGYALRNFWARIHKYYKNNVDVFLCLTDFQKQKLMEAGFKEDKCEVLPNFYNKEILESIYHIQDRSYIAFAGRISPEKGIPVLLDAARLLPHIPFQLAGQMREGYGHKLDIPENVTLRGMLDKTAMQQFYQAARMYVHTSGCYEGFPMVFPEAMANKLPIIAPKLGGYPEAVIEHYNGLLFEQGNPQNLAKLIEQLWDDSLTLDKMSRNSFDFVQERFSLEYYYSKLIATYNYIT